MKAGNSVVYGGDMSSRTTQIGQNENQSYIGKNITVKGNYLCGAELFKDSGSLGKNQNELSVKSQTLLNPHMPLMSEGKP